MFVGVRAAMLPTVMVTMASASKSIRQSALIEGRPSTKMRSSIANDAAFDPTESNAVTGVGAPSYTSGAHMWNGTAAILNATPAAVSTTRSEEHTSELQSQSNLVCRLLLEKKTNTATSNRTRRSHVRRLAGLAS